jgi:hypothetical protein
MENKTMAKSKETTVNTIGNDPITEAIESQDHAKLFAALAAKFQGTPLALSIEKELHEKNVVAVSQRVAEINSLIAELRSEIDERNDRILHLMGEKANLGIDEVAKKRAEYTARVACVECGQKRHADNEKTRNCASYAALQGGKAVAV